ncbi:MAG TPA: hypothetical protein VND64_35905, partial [Pirellulales bacterium]|nr:hypothetical protein [Pirellulales bacterium]
YLDFDGIAISLEGLDAEERRLLGRLERRARTHPDWCDFDNYWMPAVVEFYHARGLSRRQTIQTSIYRIAQDLSARLGIAQRMVRAPDYLDQLEDLVLNQFPSRRAFCKASGLSEVTLDDVLAGRVDLSLRSLHKALERAGYRLRILPAERAKRTG